MTGFEHSALSGEDRVLKSRGEIRAARGADGIRGAVDMTSKWIQLLLENHDVARAGSERERPKG
jgi:hypothetical protein